MKSLIVPAREDRLDDVLAFVAEGLEERGCPTECRLEIELAIEEIFVNIANYAYCPADGEAEVRYEVLSDPPRAVVQFLDGGARYDPLAKEDADTSVEALESREGGLGILLIRRMMDDVTYSYDQGKNILTIFKKLEPPEQTHG